jgi:DNA-directed RNA polymerase subunit omega
MMLYPPMADLVAKVGSRYLLVNLVAHRARMIAAAAEAAGIPLDKKPVSSAIDEVYTGKLTVKSFGKEAEETQADVSAPQQTESESAAAETE